MGKIVKISAQYTLAKMSDAENEPDENDEGYVLINLITFELLDYEI